MLHLLVPRHFHHTESKGGVARAGGGGLQNERLQFDI